MFPKDDSINSDDIDWEELKAFERQRQERINQYFSQGRTPMVTHFFCPAFPSRELQGQFKFTPITCQASKEILSRCFWVNPERPEFKHYLDVRSIDDDISEIQWRHRWNSVGKMLFRNGFRIPDQMGRLGAGAGSYDKRMQPGDVGLVFAPINVSLREHVEPQDFEIYFVERVS